jgi:hypothetical protein
LSYASNPGRKFREVRAQGRLRIGKSTPRKCKGIRIDGNEATVGRGWIMQV